MYKVEPLIIFIKRVQTLTLLTLISPEIYFFSSKYKLSMWGVSYCIDQVYTITKDNVPVQVRQNSCYFIYRGDRKERFSFPKNTFFTGSFYEQCLNNAAFFKRVVWLWFVPVFKSYKPWFSTLRRNSWSILRIH